MENRGVAIDPMSDACFDSEPISEEEEKLLQPCIRENQSTITREDR